MDVSFDSTFSFGVQLRTESPDKKNYCTTIGGPNALDPGNNVPDGAGDGPGENGDCGKSAGNLNYNLWAPTSTILKGIHELDASYGNYSAFVRFQWWYDGINQHGERARTPLTDDAKWQMGAGAQLLDAYLQGNWYPADIPISFKVGNVVLNWGESTFLQNGLNVINPIDVRRLRVPGAELRDALLAVPITWASVSPTEFLSIEGFYQWWWSETIVDPPGTYFSVHDALGPGGQYFDISRGANDCDIAPLVPTVIKDDTSPAGVSPGLGLYGNLQNGSLGASCIARGGNLDARNHGQYGFAARFFLPGAGGTELGLFFLNTHSRLPIVSGSYQETLQDAGEGIVGPGYTPGDNPFVDLAAANEVLFGSRANQFYPEDVKKVGASFSSAWDRFSLAFQGEFAYAIDQPLQLSEIQLLNGLFESAGLAPPGSTAPGVPLAEAGQFYSGAIKRDVITAQVTMTYVGEPGRVIGDWLGADQFLFITEWGYMNIVGYDDPSYLPLQASVTPQSIARGNTANQFSAYATQDSVGYVIRAALPYNNLVWGANVRPFVSWSHGVYGHSPAPLLNYSAGAMALNFGVSVDYQNQWSGSIGYTNFLGNGVNNPRNDRDFLSFDIKYAF